MKPLALRVFSYAFVCVIAASACSGGGGGSSPGLPAQTGPTNAPTGVPTATAPSATPSSSATLAANAYTFPIANGSTVALPSYDGPAAGSTIAFPASGIPSGESVTFTASTTAPANVPATLEGTARASGRAPFGIGTGASMLAGFSYPLSFSTTFTLGQTPAIQIETYALVPNRPTFGAFFDTTYASAQQLVVVPGTVTQGVTGLGPLAVDVLKFPAVDLPASLTFTQGHAYFFGVFQAVPSPNPTATPSAAASPSPASPSPGAGPTSAPSVSPAPTAAPVLSPIVLSPKSMTFLALGTPQALAASESGYSGTFAATSGDSSVATVTASASGGFAVTPAGAGSTTIVVTDANGQSASLAVSVTTTTVSGN